MESSLAAIHWLNCTARSSYWLPGPSRLVVSLAEHFRGEIYNKEAVAVCTNSGICFSRVLLPINGRWTSYPDRDEKQQNNICRLFLFFPFFLPFFIYLFSFASQTSCDCTVKPGERAKTWRRVTSHSLLLFPLYRWGNGKSSPYFHKVIELVGSRMWF